MGFDKPYLNDAPVMLCFFYFDGLSFTGEFSGGDIDCRIRVMLWLWQYLSFKESL